MARKKMKEVIFDRDYTIRVILTDNTELSYDMKRKLITARFKGIEKWEDFSRGEIVKGNTIHWDEGVELTLSEIMLYTE